MRRSSRPARLPGGASNLRPHPYIPAFIGSALVRPRATMPKLAALAQMAIDMREIEAAKGGVTGDDLQLLGFTAAQVSALGTEAALRAQLDAAA